MEAFTYYKVNFKLELINIQQVDKYRFQFTGLKFLLLISMYLFIFVEFIFQLIIYHWKLSFEGIMSIIIITEHKQKENTLQITLNSHINL